MSAAQVCQRLQFEQHVLDQWVTALAHQCLVLELVLASHGIWATWRTPNGDFQYSRFLGRAFSLSVNSGTRVFFAECDPFCALQAFFEGVQVAAI